MKYIFMFIFLIIVLSFISGFVGVSYGIYKETSWVLACEEDNVVQYVENFDYVECSDSDFYLQDYYVDLKLNHAAGTNLKTFLFFWWIIFACSVVVFSRIQQLIHEEGYKDAKA